MIIVRKRWRLLGFITFLLVLLCWPQQSFGQDSPITATVNKTNFSTDELVILTVNVVDASVQQPRPILPRLDGLAVIDLDIATDVSVVGGKIQTSVTYTYRLQPRRTGLLTIPPVTVEIDGQTSKTPPISINISQGAVPAPSPGNEVSPDDIEPPAALNGQDFFVESYVDLLSPYIGQQIVHTFRFYQAIQLYREPQFEGPRFSGFETLGLPVREYNLPIGDRTYLITEIRTALFPLNSGNITISPARLMIPGNFYEDPVELYTEPVTIEARPLPDNAPPGFNGAVGQYEIEAWFSPEVAIINQPSTFYVAVNGIGNIQSLPDPIWPELSEWRIYDTLTGLTSETDESGQVSGTRVFERLVVPNQIGDLTIPSVTLVYFDPIAAQYQTITTNPLPVKIIPPPTPAPATATAVVVVPTATPASLAANLNPPSADDSASELPALFDTDSYSWAFPLTIVMILGLCGLIPLAAAIGAGGFWLWQRRQTIPSNQDIETINQSNSTLQQPQQTIHPVLAAAMRENDNNYRAVSQALNTYLGQALQTSINGLTRTDLAGRLREIGLEEALIRDIDSCLSESEMGRFGPSSTDAGWSLMARADELLFAMDELFNQ